MNMSAYVFRRKGPTLIMGFTFLEKHGLVVDCANRGLTHTFGGHTLKCYSSHVDRALVHVGVQQFCINNVFPPLLAKSI